ncbi:ABC transporter ATP-binding protein [Jatrophihabitans telluris]|uniref:ABC transporter ATP-binding protein n=1 Tax=Jatrophihabitans telluris TaxID=2038343 RepID=A0ABY4QXW9_9ACTN|nr:ABC transporter ATP-binding protein [Jatrophihabitans telluris]UQX87750.1 ABC transporter ATP-binding protein [Jatrophihabitans telluris]
MMNYDHAVVVSGLTVVRGGHIVLDDLDLTMAPGQITGLLGPSGCGKTTLIRAIAGVQIIRAGHIDVLGRPAGVPSLRRRVAYVTQASSVYPDLTVTENLRYFAAMAGVVPSGIGRYLDQVGLRDQADALTGTLSGGQRTRVSLAAALLAEPELLLLDEPTVGLDPVLRRDLWQLFRSLASAGRTLLVSSHVMDEAGRCDEVLLLRQGRLIAQDSPRRLLARTGTDDLESAFLALAEATDAPSGKEIPA